MVLKIEEMSYGDDMDVNITLYLNISKVISAREISENLVGANCYCNLRVAKQLQTTGVYRDNRSTDNE